MSKEGSREIEGSPLLSSRANIIDDGGMDGGRGIADRATAAAPKDNNHQIGQQTSTSAASSSSRKPIATARMTASSEGYAQGHHNQDQQQPHPSAPGLYPQAQQIQFDMHSPPSSQPGQFGFDNETYDGSEDTPANPGGPTVPCRVCEAEIQLEGKSNQHVVRCQQCNEVTPIRAAPPGKKYVRCPCNCLLVCKATSTRIACPRQNCRRVITLASGPPNSGVPGTAIRAPVGTCRVQCAYCKEIFMFNTLTNQLAVCPHCRKSSSVGARFARSRSLLYFLALLLSGIFLIGVSIAVSHGQDNFFMWAFLIGLVAVCLFVGYRFIFYWRIRISQILGPL